MQEGLGGVGVLLLIATIWLAIIVNNQNDTIATMTNVIHRCSTAVDDANSNMGNMNTQIEDAQYSAWSNYDTMGTTLEGLTVGQFVDNPCEVPAK